MAGQLSGAPAAGKDELVEEAARSFLKAIHTLRTYPRGNEIARKALEQLLNRETNPAQLAFHAGTRCQHACPILC